MYNERDGNFDDVAISTFKVGLPNEHGLRKSLIGKLVTSMRRLMDQINKYKRVEEDQQQGKGKAKVIPQEKRDFRLKDYIGPTGSTNAQVVSAVFREPVH